MALRSLFPLLTAFALLTGCAMDNPFAAQPKPAEPPPKKPLTTAPTGNEVHKLVGSNRTALLAKYGPPNMTMEVNLAGRPPSEGYLYFPKDGKGCLHTFVIVEKTGEIADYFCR